MSRNVMVPNFFLKAYGFWQFGEKDHWLYRAHRTIGICSLVVVFSALEVVHLAARVLEKADLTKTTDDLAHAINHMLGLFKYIVMRSQRRFVQRVYMQGIRDDRLAYDDSPDLLSARQEAVDAYTIMNLKTTLCGICFASFFIVLGYSTPFLADAKTYYAADNVTMLTTRPLPFNTWAPFPEGQLPHYYWLFAYQGVCMTDVVTMMALFDYMFFGMFAQVAAQLRFLRSAIIGIQRRARRVTDENVSRGIYTVNSSEYKLQFETEMQNELTKCAIHHQVILRTSSELNRRFNKIMLFQFSTTLIVICVCLFQCLVRSGLRVDFFYMIFYALTITSELFLGCWYGKEVTSESSLIPNALFSSYWVGATPKYRSNFRLFLMRSQTPIVFSALGIFPLDLDTFGSIIKTAYSFFSVLKQMDYEST